MHAHAFFSYENHGNAPQTNTTVCISLLDSYPFYQHSVSSVHGGVRKDWKEKRLLVTVYVADTNCPYILCSCFIVPTDFTYKTVQRLRCSEFKDNKSKALSQVCDFSEHQAVSHCMGHMFMKLA